MYGPSYGFGSPPADESSPFNHPHQPHYQQQGQQGQEGQLLPQHMMYNPQAYGATPPQPMYDASGAAAMGGSPEGMALTPQQDVGGMAGMHLPGGGKSVCLFLSRWSPSTTAHHISTLLEPPLRCLTPGLGFGAGLHHHAPSRRSVRFFPCHIC